MRKIKKAIAIVEIFIISLIMPFCKSHMPDQHFVREISETNKDLFKSIQPIRDSLKLDILENGYDSLQIRIWTEFRHSQEVIVIKKNKESWSPASRSYTYS